MRWLDVLRLRMKSAFRTRRANQELDAEFQFHLDQQIEENLAAGMAPEEARYAAMRAVGGISQIKEECRDMRCVNFIEHLMQDLRYAARTMRRSPAFTIVAVVSLALGIGANTAIFSVIDALMLKRLPVTDPEHLLMFSVGTYQRFGYAWFEAFRDRIPSLMQVTAAADFDESGVTIGGSTDGDDAEQTRVALISGNYFSLLGVKTAMGRPIAQEDDREPGAHPVAVISHSFWQRKFAGSPAVLDRTFILNDVTYSIVGVAAEGFAGDWTAQPADIWIPAAMTTQVAPSTYGDALSKVQIWRILARLEPGATLEQAVAAATAVNLQMRQEDAKRRGLPMSPRIARERIELAPASRGYVPEQRSIAQPLTILMIVAGLVLLIACANMANLLLARSAVRQREIAVRLAFGAARSRIVRQVLTESLALAMIGGALGLLIAQSTTKLLLSMVSSGVIPIHAEIHPDARVLAFAIAISLATGILFGIAPARSASKISITPALTSSRDRSPAKLRMGKLLVISQVALTLLLVVGAGLFIRTLRNLKSQDFGLDQRHLIAIYTGPRMGARKNAQPANSYRKVREKIQSLAHVVSVSEIGNSLLDPGYYWIDDTATLRIEGEPVRTGHRVATSGVGPGFFSTVGAPLIAGRDFEPRDVPKDADPAVTIINQTFARFYFGNENPIGHRIGRLGCIGAPCEKDFPFEIIGVVGDINHIAPRFQHVAMAYLPAAVDGPPIGRCIVVRTLDAAGPGWGSFLRRQIREAAPEVPILRIMTVEQQLNETLGTERLIAALCGAFGLLGVALAAIGLYGVIAYTTARRTHEIGVRIALGASRIEVLEMVLKEGLGVVLIGILVGIPATLAATRLIAKWMFGIGASDPVTIAASVALMLIVAVLAALIPARRAASVDPMVALRYE
jgi:predicted permease